MATKKEIDRHIGQLMSWRKIFYEDQPKKQSSMIFSKGELLHFTGRKYSWLNSILNGVPNFPKGTKTYAAIDIVEAMLKEGSRD